MNRFTRHRTRPGGSRAFALHRIFLSDFLIDAVPKRRNHPHEGAGGIRQIPPNRETTPSWVIWRDQPEIRRVAAP